MRILSIVHERDAGPGVFAEAVAASGADVVEWVPADGAAPALDHIGAVLLFGGGMHVDHEAEHPWLVSEKRLLHDLAESGVPMLGVCLGAQLLAEAIGGSAFPASRPEIGWTDAELTPAGARDPLLGPLPRRFASFQWHSYEFALPADAVPLARSEVCLQAFRRGAVWGIQFHAEVTGETVAAWLRDYGGDEDAVRARLDADAVLVRTAREIGQWNALGEGICRRFLEYAARVTRA